MIIELIENPDVWLIISVTLVIFEIFIGSLVFFLPLGISSFIVGLILKIQQNTDMLIISEWTYSLVIWGIISIAISFIIQKYFKVDSKKDVNNY
tara:strand:+ start:62434 stop:62715 length:282 start_codon:yes stop_codon:yes gene_type:complete